MYPFNRCVVRRSWWLSQIPISSLNPSKILIEDGKEPRHGAELVYDEAMQLPNRVMAAFVSGGFYVLLMFFFASSLVSYCVATVEGHADVGGGTEIRTVDDATRNRCINGVRATHISKSPRTHKRCYLES